MVKEKSEVKGTVIISYVNYLNDIYLHMCIIFDDFEQLNFQNKNKSFYDMNTSKNKIALHTIHILKERKSMKQINFKCNMLIIYLLYIPQAYGHLKIQLYF